MKHPVEISTDRLILKSITPGLINEWYQTKSKEQIMHFFGVDESGFEHFKNMHEMGMETYRISLFFFLLIDKQRNIPIGECGFHTWNKLHNRAELFYSLRNDAFKRMGYMKEALRPVLHFGFHTLDLHRIEALVADWNIASVKLLLHYNFTKEGTMREDYLINGRNEDSDCYSLLKREWEK